MDILLSGIGGSHAYGLAREGSDEDRIGVFGHPTNLFWNLTQPTQSIVSHEPDSAMHEVGKFMSLASKSNPTVLETLALDSYEERNIWGNLLIEKRSAFFSANYVQKAFLGYAESQFRKMMTAWEQDRPDSRSRSPKNARHMIRLLDQGHHLYTTGELRVRVPDPQRYFDYENWTKDQLQEEFVRKWGEFVDAKTCLPDEPDMPTINGILHAYRKSHVE